MMSNTAWSLISVLVVLSHDVVSQECVSTQGIEFDNCLEFNEFDIFWNNITTTIDLLFETPDNGWSALGWSSQRGNTGMVNSNVVFGCIDAVTATPAGADFFLATRSGGGQNPEGRQGLLSYVVTRMNSVCSVRFERPVTPTGVDANGNDELQALDQGISRMVAARGGNTIAIHNQFRGRMDLDFAVSQQNMIDPPPTPAPTAIPTPVETGVPTPVETGVPTPVETDVPTPMPTLTPMPVPMPVPSPMPSPVPTPEVTMMPTEQPNPCTTTRGIEFENCREIQQFDVFWNSFNENDTTIDMLYETADDGWSALGFSSSRGMRAMVGSNVVFGCVDQVDPTPAGADYELTSQSPAGVNPRGRQGLLSYEVIRANGVCSVRFERPLQPMGLDELHALNVGVARVVVARGGPTIGFHSERRSIDFDLAIAQQNEIIPPPFIPSPAPTPAPPAPIVCTSTAGIVFDNCIEIEDFDVFWNTFNGSTIDILYETPDNGWSALGFSSSREENVAMVNSNVVFGCIDAINATAEGADYFLSARSLAGVNQEGRQGLLSYSVTQTNGVCSIRFERPLRPDGVDRDGMDELQALNNGVSRLVAARGGPMLGIHNQGRSFMDLDLAISQQNVITPPPTEMPVPGETTMPNVTMPNGTTAAQPDATEDGLSVAATRTLSLAATALLAACAMVFA